ncbi:MAG: hypothetical protein IJW12_01880, partial [Opitutales bacterium]|nr:hypothetical protein [Opitutales bacterium]
MKIKIYFLLLSLFFTSCVSYEPCRAWDMVADPVSVRSKTLLNLEISVEKVVGGQKTDPSVCSNVGNVGFKNALEYSLARSGIYSEQGELQLTAMLVHEKISVRRTNVGQVFDVKEEVHYVLRQKKNGVRLFKSTITGIGSAGGPEFYSSAALRVAKERAMK